RYSRRCLRSGRGIGARPCGGRRPRARCKRSAGLAASAESSGAASASLQRRTVAHAHAAAAGLAGRFALIVALELPEAVQVGEGHALAAVGHVLAAFEHGVDRGADLFEALGVGGHYSETPLLRTRRRRGTAVTVAGGVGAGGCASGSAAGWAGSRMPIRSSS